MKKIPEHLGMSLTRTVRFVLQVVDADWIMSTISFTQIPPRNFQQLAWQVIEKLSATLNSKHWGTGTMYIECTFFGDKYLWEFVRDPRRNGTLKVHTPYGLELEFKVGHQTKIKFKFDQSKIPFLLRWVISCIHKWQ